MASTMFQGTSSGILLVMIIAVTLPLAEAQDTDWSCGGWNGCSRSCGGGRQGRGCSRLTGIWPFRAEHSKSEDRDCNTSPCPGPTINVSPSSSRITSGTNVNVSCNYNHNHHMYFSPSVSGNQFTADPSHTGSLGCCSYESHQEGPCGHTVIGATECSPSHKITVVPKAPILRFYSTSHNPTVGEEITLSCEAELWTPTYNAPIHYKVMKDSAEIYSGNSTTYTFKIAELTGSYTCVIFAGTEPSSSSTPKSIASVQPFLTGKTPALYSTTAAKPDIGDVTTLICEYSSNSSATITYRFMKHSVEFHSGSRRTYSFTTTDQSSGSYTCMVFEDVIPSAPSPSVTVAVRLPVTGATPVLYSTSRKPDIGDGITLVCDYVWWTSSATINYTFMKNSAVIHSGTNKTYTFTATEQSSGSYSCRVVGVGTTISAYSSPSVISVRLPTTKPPTLYTSSSKPNIGDDMTLICDYAWTGSISITYTFMINSTVVYSGTNKTFSLSVTETSTGSYSCKAHAGTVTSALSSYATVTVGLFSSGLHSTGQILGSHTPVLYSSARNPQVGDVITLICDYVLIESVSITYEFMIDGAKVHSGANKTYTFTVRETSSGSYSCGVSAGTVSSKHSSPSNVAVSLPVNKTPSLYSSSSKPNIGDDVTLICDYVWTGSVTITYEFMINSAIVHSGGNKTFTFTVTEQSTGSYSCIVHAGTITSSPSHPVNVAVRPPVTTPMSTIPTTTTQSPIPFPCESGLNAVFDYTYGYDPAKYIHCEVDGKAYIKSCPYGKLWNQAIRKCEASSPQVG